MAGAARLARELNYEVSGTDSAFYPPMNSQLRALNIKCHQGFDADIKSRPADIYIVGNAISRGNPLMESLMDSGLPYLSAPQWIFESVLRPRGKKVIAVAGTHGKTTAASMLAWILECAGKSPGFLIGGMPGNFESSARFGEGEFFVAEADEYDSAFFDKRPKFLHCRPHIAMMTNLEFDHADIYPDLSSIKKQFHYFVRTIPSGGAIVANAACPNLREVLAMGCWTKKTLFFGEGGKWQWEFDGKNVAVICNGEAAAKIIAPQFFGEMNRANAIAAIAAADECGIPPDISAKALSTFRSAARRLQKIAGDSESAELFDDFAHHPTAIACAISALREMRPNRRVLAVFEPRSNTMRAGVWRNQLADSLADADLIFALDGGNLKWSLADSLANLPAKIFNSPDELHSAVMASAEKSDCILMMSNGDFCGLRARLCDSLGVIN